MSPRSSLNPPRFKFHLSISSHPFLLTSAIGIAKISSPSTRHDNNLARLFRLANRNSSSLGAGDVGDGSGNLTSSPLPAAAAAAAAHTFSAPFLTTWLCNAATVLYLPLYAAGKAVAAVAKSSPGGGGLRLALRGAVQNFRERGFTTCEFSTVRAYYIQYKFHDITL